MRKETKNLIDSYRKNMQMIAEHFVIIFYDKETLESDCCYWIGNDVGGCLSVNDDYYNINRMVEAIELGVTYEQLNDYSQYCIDSNNKPINFKNFVKYGQQLCPDFYLKRNTLAELNDCCQDIQDNEDYDVDLISQEAQAGDVWQRGKEVLLEKVLHSLLDPYIDLPNDELEIKKKEIEKMIEDF